MTNMTELVERLRRIAKRESEDYGARPESHVNWQAADEIERLSAELAEAKRLAADRLAQMDADRKQALAWRDELAALGADEGRLK